MFLPRSKKQKALIFFSPIVYLQEFKYDRFVDAKFYKDGKEVQHPIIAFGSLCPGQRFAILQLKWYIMCAFNKYEMKLKDGEHAEYDFAYHGHEILPPVKDVQFEIQKRSNTPQLVYLWTAPTYHSCLVEGSAA